MKYQNVQIESLAYVIPSLEIRTQDIEQEIAPLYQRLGLKPGWLQAVTGIRARRFWESQLQPSDIATRAAEKALQQAWLFEGSCELSASLSSAWLVP